MFSTVCSRYSVVLGNNGIEPRYKRGTLCSLCFRMCRQVELASNEHVASHTPTISFEFGISRIH